MKRVIFIMLAMLPLVFVGCSNDDEEPQEVNTFDFILGHWDETAYQGNNDTFLQSSTGVYFEFRSDKTFTYYKGWAINESEINTFMAIPETNTVVCKWSNGNDRIIKVDFEDENNAIFSISNANTTYKTKMKRKQ